LKIEPGRQPIFNPQGGMPDEPLDSEESGDEELEDESSEEKAL
jgi:hypothetical protein